MADRTFKATANVYTTPDGSGAGHLLYAAGDDVPWADAVDLGLVSSDTPAPPPVSVPSPGRIVADTDDSGLRGRLLYAEGDPIPYDEAVRLGVVDGSDLDVGVTVTELALNPASAGDTVTLPVHEDSDPLVQEAAPPPTSADVVVGDDGSFGSPPMSVDRPDGGLPAGDVGPTDVEPAATGDTPAPAPPPAPEDVLPPLVSPDGPAPDLAPAATPTDPAGPDAALIDGVDGAPVDLPPPDPATVVAQPADLAPTDAADPNLITTVTGAGFPEAGATDPAPTPDTPPVTPETASE